ncbi:TetR/AcrR family transcriptional regulator [Nocardioides sp. NPDC051685]|uniref:TetR/AcrR family transcriptional regulator n=1 Tax=Nocardioides sp. NPDC051685 TaxID=3364334 RepID=UPI0037A0C3FB
MTTTPRAVGRPRLVPAQLAGSPRDQILEVAARLFTSKGYAATSTREIADAVGIRQAWLYYHFNGKGEIVTELLSQTIRPTVEAMARIESLADDPETALYLLALTDVRTLTRAPHNVGLLYLAVDGRPGRGVRGVHRCPRRPGGHLCPPGDMCRDV